jgi:phosphatidylglycerol lysyltransferase
VVLSPDLPNSLRASVALAVALALLALWRLLRPGRVGYLVWNEPARQRYAALGGEPPARADGMVWGEAGRAGIPFRRTSRVLVGIGDPVGAESDRISAIWRLRDLARQERLEPAIWRAGREHLKVYADLGLAALALGADGLPLADGGEAERAPATRYLVCRAERDLPVLLPLLPELARADGQAGPSRPGTTAPPVR